MDNKGELLNTLQEACDVEDRDQAEKVAAAVLHQLHDRLGPEADHLAAQLPEDVKPLYEGGMLERIKDALTPDDKIHFDQLVQRVADEGDVGTDVALEATMHVFSQLKAHISDGQARHVAAALPGDIQEVWDRA